MLKMARVVKRNSDSKRLTLRTRGKSRENFAHISAFCGKSPGFLGVGRIVAKQVAVLLDS